ncbi:MULTISPECIES: gas vesicle protein [Streptomyces]|uniref:Gas vesicle protein n=2 Tax=Streptomyces TaxID=1883 RepID=A0A1V0U504_STRVN|nr:MULTISPECIES: gas vesicle protein [Streptomyces]ARF60160.1 gas vesicle protein [Streptomyces violaceoruber]KOG82458.1 gas vesicle protein [Streptomyces griseus subsp. rhodochrous]KOU12451.1 gas vesicle protein [Streptomyces sp. NRRL F-2295]KOU47275.1 gas vesicle protein [Streptomyces sp. MMG1522]MBD3544102.1 gas vesicle protein [Streptomyces sp. JV180]
MADQRSARATGPARARKKTASAQGPEHAARAACRSLEGLIDHPAEGVSAVRRSDDDGWCVVVDVLEVPRIPDTTSLLASYEVRLDGAGELQEYRRVRRYRRGAADE